MSAIAYYLERQGLMTTGISLVREHTEAMAPPRFLWVPFPLGRPLGEPGNPGFQHAVIEAALALLDEPSGPVLRDYPVEAGATAPSSRTWACPVSFPAVPVEGSGQVQALARELAALEPWYSRAVARRGRSTVGAQDLPVNEALRCLADFEHDPSRGLRPLASGQSLVRSLKLMVEDVKAYYLEAATAQGIGTEPGALAEDPVQRWFWTETEAGRLVVRLSHLCAGHADAGLRAIAHGALVPRQFSGRAGG